VSVTELTGHCPDEVLNFSKKTLDLIRNAENKTNTPFVPSEYENILFMDESYLWFSQLNGDGFSEYDGEGFFRKKVKGYKSYQKKLKGMVLGLGRVCGRETEEGMVKYEMDMLFSDGFVSYKGVKDKTKNSVTKSKSNGRKKSQTSKKKDEISHWTLMGELPRNSIVNILNEQYEGITPKIYICSQSYGYVKTALKGRRVDVDLIEINGGHQENNAAGAPDTFEQALKQEAGLQSARRLWIDLDQPTRQQMLKEKLVYSLRYGSLFNEKEFLKRIRRDKDTVLLDPISPIYA
jgi:hypothetical protein